MNLEELKSNWKNLDDKVLVSQKLSEKMILSILKDQSKSTVSKIQNQVRTGILFFAGLFILFIAILAGNPFDYAHWYEYIPAIAYTLLIIAGLGIMIREISSINKIVLSRDNLRESLGKIIVLHESYKGLMEQVWKISMLMGFLLGISLMVRNFQNYGFTKSIFLVIADGVTVALIYFMAKEIIRKLPEKNLEELKMNLAELDE